jgi:hypothetical protein
LVWTRQRQVNQLRSTLREYYPAALDLGELYGSDALGVLAAAPTPSLGRTLSRTRIAAAIGRAGRQRRIDQRAGEIQARLRAEQLSAPALVSEAMGASVAALVAVITELNTQISRLEEQLGEGFDQHPDAKVVRSLPGLGTILGARVLAEFGDDPNRYADAKARKNYAGTSPVSKASGKSRVVLARYARNRRLSDACYLWAFASVNASPGARAYTMPDEPQKTPTTGPYEPLPTASSASSTAASNTTPSTTNKPRGPTAQHKLLDKLRPWDV